MLDESFDDLMAMLDTPALVVTTQADGHPSGCLVGFATQTSIQPRLFLVGISRANHTFGVASQSEYLAVHVLARRHRALAELFGGQTGDEINKFERCSWRGGPAGVPILDAALAWFVGRTVCRIDLADHVGYLLQPLAVWAPETSEDVLYLSDVEDIEAGHEASQTVGENHAGNIIRRYNVPKFTLNWPS